MTPHEGVWANGGFAFFYDDPSFDCVFKLSKVSAACGSWPPRSATAPCPGVTGGLFRLVAAPSSRDQRPSRAGPTSPVCEEAAVRPQGPANSLTLRPSPFNPGDASVTARQPAATRVVRRPPECRVRIRGPSRDRGPKRDVGAGRAIRAARWRERRKRSRRFPRRSQRRSIGYRPEATPHFLTQSPFIGSLASDPVYTLQSHIFVYRPRPVVAHPKFASLPHGRRPAASRLSKHGPPRGRS